jgi:MFS transporter, OFA family, oxalate/formate antiporter
MIYSSFEKKNYLVIKMSEEKIMNRWLVVIGAVLIQLALGAIYAWSVFTTPLVAAPYSWTKTQTQIVFSVGLATFALVMVAAGQKILPKLGTQKLAMLGGIVLGLGYLLAGLVDVSVASLVILVGFIGGAGIGLAYVVPIGVGMKWFPDKKGMITGLAVAGFGFGATIWVYLGKYLVAETSLKTTFIVFGVIFLVMVLVGGFFMVNPPEGYLPEGYTPPTVTIDGTKEDFSMEPSQMVKTPQYIMILLTFVFSAMSGLMTIGLAKLYPKEAMIANGIGVDEAEAAATLSIAVFYSLMNGIGRITWGTISDKLGVKKSIFLMCIIQGITMIAFTWMASTPATLYLGMSIIGFNFGGNFALFPGMTASIFGKEKVSANYGWVFLAYGIAGIVGPLMGGAFGDASLFSVAFILSGILTLGSAVIISLVKPIEQAKSE